MQFNHRFESEILTEMESVGRRKRYDPDEVVMEIGNTISFMPIILSGSLKVLTEDENYDDLLLYYLEEGDTCAMTLQCCSNDSISHVKAITETETEVLFIPVSKMEEWMVRYPSWRRFVLDTFNDRFNEMLRSIDHLVFNNLESRLKKYLQDKSIINKSKKLHLTHAEVANDLHSSRVVISRLMKKLENESILIQGRNSIEILKFP